MRSAALGLIFVVLTPGTLWAGTREDVTDSISRCTGIADDRQWLECFYGAAQPMRARLGLPPAPESQQILSRAPALALSPSAPPVRAMAAPPPSTISAMHDFGKPVRSDHVDRETGRIASFSFDQYGIFTVTLTDGQVWQQTSSDSTKAQWHATPSQRAYNVIISEGLFGSYTLKVVNLPGAYKVRRIK